MADDTSGKRGVWVKRGAIGAGCVAVFLVAAQVADRLNTPDAPLPTPTATPVAIASPVASPTPVVTELAQPKPRVTVAAVTAPEPQPQAQPADYTVKSILKIKKPFRHGDWYWDESAAPKAGRIVVTVDLKAQVLSVFRDGHEIGTAVMIYGADEKPTPLGVFNVSFRKANHTSSIYKAPMPYTLRLTNDGVAIHGSASMRPDAATHGCVGVPVRFAKKLFDVVKMGDTVIVTNGERLDMGEPITAATKRA